MEERDTYKTIIKATEEVLFKEKKSKFYGFAFPIENEEDAKQYTEELRKRFPTANHVCYSWQLGVQNPSYRANDDGEPNNSAGMPIYGQIQSFEVTNILVAVVRVFGGTKLGVGGLISAYRETAKLVLEQAVIMERVIEAQLCLKFEYAEMDQVMRFIKRKQLRISSQKLNLDCEIRLAVRKSEMKSVVYDLKTLHKIEVSVMD